MEAVVAGTDGVPFVEQVAHAELVGAAFRTGITCVTKTVLSNVRPVLPVLDLRTARPAVKTADRELLTGEHKAWREAVLSRAGHRCEWVAHGVRCERTSPTNRMFADHVVERQDGGAALDVANGRCLCASHHGLKTFRERARRMARPT